MYLFLKRCRKSNNVWLRALMQCDCLYSSLFYEHYNHILWTESSDIAMLVHLECVTSQDVCTFPGLELFSN